MSEEDKEAKLPAAVLCLLTEKQGEEATSESLEGLRQAMVSLAVDQHSRNILLL